MPSADPGARPVRPADVERWLTDLGLEPVDRAERDGIASWDLVLDGRRRFDLRVTVILDPSLALICWAHFAPPISDMFRKSYRKLLRWNDEFPFAKFSIGDDERPLLAVELPIGDVESTPDGQRVEALGLALARIVGIADRLLDESAVWLWIGGRMPDPSNRTPRNPAFLARYDEQLAELTGPVDASLEIAEGDALASGGESLAMSEGESLAMSEGPAPSVDAVLPEDVAASPADATATPDHGDPPQDVTATPDHGDSTR
jgi:Putative bacterial sensory transduction regulator